EVGEVDSDAELGAQPVMFAVPPHPADVHPWMVAIAAAEFHPLADGARIGPVSTSHILVNNHDPRRLFCIVFGKEAPADERDLHRLEIANAGGAPVSLNHALPGRGVIAINRDAA